MKLLSIHRNPVHKTGTSVALLNEKLDPARDQVCPCQERKTPDEMGGWDKELNINVQKWEYSAQGKKHNDVICLLSGTRNGTRSESESAWSALDEIII